MEGSEAGSAGATAGHGRLDRALARLEQSIEASAKKFKASLTRITGTLETRFGSLDKNFERLEVKLDRTSKSLVAIAGQIKETENSLSLLVDGILKIIQGDLIEGGRKIFSAAEPTQERKKQWELQNQDPNQLLNDFKYGERQVASLNSGGDPASNKGYIDEIRDEQQLIWSALKTRARAIRSEIERMQSIPEIGSEQKDIEGIKRAEQSLRDVLEVLKKIGEFAISDELQKNLDERPPIPDMLPQQHGALETSPGALQLARDGGEFTDARSDTLRDTLRELGVTVEDTEGSVSGLADAVGRFVDQGGSLNALVAATNDGLQGQSTLLGIIRGQVPELGQSLTGLFSETSAGAESLDRRVAALGEQFLDAFEGAILRGEDLGDVLKGLGLDLAELALQEAT